MAFNQTAFLNSTDFTTAVQGVVVAKTYNWIADIDASFLLTSGYLVFIMQLGFALLTVGSVRAKSAKSVCLKNIMDAAFGGCGYFLFGWAFAYGDKQTCDDTGVCSSAGNAFIGTQNFASIAAPQYATFVFQYVFAISTATIVSGAVAERVKFIAYALYAFFLTAWVYPVLTHWVWTSSGWASPTRTVGPLLFGSGAYDTVGSGAVHMVGGVAALAGALIAGPRIGRFTNGRPNKMPGHNAVFYMMGVILLWFGFYGFNPGTMAQIIASDGTSFSQVVARCAISTTLGACFGGVTALFLHLIYSRFFEGKAVWDLFAAGNGALVGTIIITSGCGTFEPWASAVGGIVGGLVYLPSSLFFLHVCKIDDPVDAVSVHMTGGAVGVIFYALFAKAEYVTELYGLLPDGSQRHYGLIMGGGGTVLAANIVWILVIFGWTFSMMAPFFFILKLLGVLRVSPEEEQIGVDVSKHGGHSYPGMDDVLNQYESSAHGGYGKVVPVENGNGAATAGGLKQQVASLEESLASVKASLKRLEGADAV